jgi:threonine dehydratase
VAWAGRLLGIRADVFLGETSSPAKQARIRRLGAQLHLVPGGYDQAHHAAEEYAKQTGQFYVHAFAAPAVMAAQGVIGLELLAQRSGLTTMIVPVGGGGLISGITVALKTLRPDIRVVAVQPNASPALSLSLRDNTIYEEYDPSPTIADGVAGGVGRAVVALAQAGWIDQVVDLPEDGVRRALAWIVREEGWLIEGAAALAVAALLEGAVAVSGPVALVLSGGNIATEVVMDILGEK